MDQAMTAATRTLGPRSSGALMTPWEFDHAEFRDGYRYELINGVLVVAPIPSESERDPNEELGHWLREYKEHHAQGSALNATLPEQTIATKKNRRRADRVIWAGLGRRPRRRETPTIAVEFVSEGKRSRTRDYEAKRREYLALDIKEYSIIDRFERTMTVFSRIGQKVKKRVLCADQVYRTTLLPGFELPLARLFAVADLWPGEDSDDG
jgi:Uma2 family endonuclease